ncbi:MAG: ATP-dependent DNA ligase [Phycisphaerales bacterium]
MKRFAQLFDDLDKTTRTSEKVAALERYFRDTLADDSTRADAAWTLALLTGRRVKRAITSTHLRALASELAHVEPWMLAECHDAVGDLGETVALLLENWSPPEASTAPTSDLRLHDVMERLRAMVKMDDASRARTLTELWAPLSTRERLVLNKLLSTSFRFGASAKLAVRGLAAATGLDEALLAHRTAGDWEPTPDAIDRITAPADAEGAAHADASRPFPFFLASQLDIPSEPALADKALTAALGDRGAWIAEWKWDGVRAQILKHNDTVSIWSRGDELVTDAYPELVDAARDLPGAFALDGEILAWDDANDRPLPFTLLHRRLNRKRVEHALFQDVPVVFTAYDLLSLHSADLHEQPLESRRAALEQLVGAPNAAIRLSPVIAAADWDALAALRVESRDRLVEGLMLKRLGSAYQVGRKRGDWWKWKIDPHTIDAVLVYAQRGSGRRASLFTDYTFAVWSGNEPGAGELVPFAKAYSGLTDDEIAQVDAWVSRNTTGRHGPVRVVKPELVFELAFEGVQESDRHKSGLALRFPRMHRWRTDKPPSEANTVADVRAILDAELARSRA